METRTTKTKNQEWDSPVERNLQSDGQEGVKANIPHVAPTINRLHLEQKKLSGARRKLLREEKKRVAGQANADTGGKKRPEQTPVRGRLGLGRRLPKEPETAQERVLHLTSIL